MADYKEEIKKIDIQNYNLYKIKMDLRDFANRLSKLTIYEENVDKSILTFDKKSYRDKGKELYLFLLEFKAYIFDNEPLKKFFILEVKQFDDYRKTQEYIKDINFLTEQLTSNLTNSNHFGKFLLRNEKFAPLDCFRDIPSYIISQDNINNIMFTDEDVIYYEDYDLLGFFSQCIGFGGDYEIFVTIGHILSDNFTGMPEYLLSELTYYCETYPNTHNLYMYFKMTLNSCIDDLYKFVNNKIIEYYTNDENRIKELNEQREQLSQKKLNRELKIKQIDFSRYDELKQFNAKQQKIINAIVNRRNPQEIAKDLNYSIRTIYNKFSEISEILFHTGIKKGKKGGYVEILKFFENKKKYYMQKKK